MRPFGLANVIFGAVLCSFATPSIGQGVHADSIEPLTLEVGNGAPASCNSEGIVVYVPQHSSGSESPCPTQAREIDETARARAYLTETATPGYTMTRQGPERAIGRLHPAFVKRLAAAIAEARAAGLPFAGIFSAYRPPAFGVGGFADKFHSLHTYGLAVDVTRIGAPGTPTALLWHEIAARHGVICPYGPNNLVEWNHCQPTQVRIILPENPLRETVTAEGPIVLEDMFEVGYSLIATLGDKGGPTTGPPVDPLSAANMKTGHNQTTPKTGLSVFDRYTMRWLPLSGGKVSWPKGVPRIAKLDDKPRRLNSPVAIRTLSPKPILIPRVIADSNIGQSAIRSAQKTVERLRQARSNTTVPNSAELAKTCRALAIKAHPTQRAGRRTAYAQNQRDHFQECVAKRSQKLA